MLKCISLNKKHFNIFTDLNNSSKNFNNLNEDFFSLYRELNFIQRFFLVRRVKLLKKDNEIIGFYWLTKHNTMEYTLNSIYVKDKFDLIDKYMFVIDALSLNGILTYRCEKNSFNYKVLKSIGFEAVEGTYEMQANIKSNIEYNAITDVQFEILQKNKQEELRCKIQNEVFKNETRIPLTIEDIYYDEEQSYYYDNGAVFIKKENEYIGYGQIIIVDNIPVIVNVGILKAYRGNGYGEALMHYLINYLYNQGFSEVKLRVSASNSVAINLYKRMGFSIIKETHRWEYRKRSTL
jgi:ribosomal protein S18 acetylase RimI-like enzyme